MNYLQRKLLLMACLISVINISILGQDENMTLKFSHYFSNATNNIISPDDEEIGRAHV